MLSQSFSFVVVSGIKDVTNAGDFFILLGFAWIVQPFLFTFFHYLVACSVEFAIANLPSQTPKRERIYLWLVSKRCLGIWKHWREGLNAFIVTFAAFFLSLFVAAIFIASPADRQESLWKLNIALYSLPISAAYLYQYDTWVRQRRTAKLASQAKNKSTKKSSPQKSKPSKLLPPVNSTEQALNSLKVENGIIPAKNVRDETPQWYVFRGGQAEGPYTKQQLQSVQKITARTNVRRTGEEIWTRAGDIQELKDFLTIK